MSPPPPLTDYVLGVNFSLIGLSNTIMVIFFLSGMNLSIFLTAIYRIENAPKILFPRSKEQDESQPLHSILPFIARFPKLL